MLVFPATKRQNHRAYLSNTENTPKALLSERDINVKAEFNCTDEAKGLERQKKYCNMEQKD